MKSRLITLCKVVLVISAAVMLILRYYTFSQAASLDESVSLLLNRISYFSAALVALSATVWYLWEKKHKSAPEEYEIKMPEWLEKEGTDNTNESSDTENS